MKACKHCGKPVTARRELALYCNVRCQDAAAYLRRKARRQTAMFPSAPVRRILAMRADPDDETTSVDLADEAGLPRSVMSAPAWDAYTADKLAIALGYHPAQLWGAQAWIDAALGPGYDPTVDQEDAA